MDMTRRIEHVHIGFVTGGKPSRLGSVCAWNILVDALYKTYEELFGIPIISTGKLHKLHITHPFKRYVKLTVQ